MAEFDCPSTLYCPIKDFDIPDDMLRFNFCIDTAIKEMKAKKEPIFFGCAGGIGRTGLFLACIAKALNIKNPINYVREYYNSMAIETTKQEDFINKFEYTTININNISKNKLIN